MQSHAETPAVKSDDRISSRGPNLEQPQQRPCDPGEALGELNVQLGQLREAKPDSALCRAYSTWPQLLDDDHKRSFLHTENCNVKTAADRMVSYWEARADLFGEERMLLPMNKIGSLKLEDSLALDQGLLQLLPHKDGKGRGLVLFDPSRHDTKAGYPIESMLRVV